MSRTKNSILNILSNSLGSIFNIVISFLSRIVFLTFLNSTYLGVSGLFSNILLIFSFVELGIGAALTQMFYKPFQDKDYRQLSIVTYTTKKLLNGVGIVIVCLTILFTPFLQLFVNDINAVPNMRLIFLLYGFSSSITYFLGYYRTIITSNQKSYKLVKIDLLFSIFKFCLQSIILFIFKNFIIYLISQILLQILQNIIVMLYVRKKYNFIDYKCHTFLSKNESRKLVKNISALSLSRLAVIITNGTDNIVISKFMNLAIVGCASNYIMITQSVSSLVESIFGPLLSSIGNLCVSESNEKKYEMFNNLSFLSFWLYCFCSITTFCLATPFVKLVFGKNLIIPTEAIFFLSFDIFCTGLYRVATLFRTAEGLFWYGKFRPLIQSILNLFFTLLLVSWSGQLWAVYAGTVLSRLAITVWYEPYIVLRYGVKQNCTRYFINMFFNFFSYFIILFIVYGVSLRIQFDGILYLIFAGVICILVINIVLVLLYFKNKEFIFWFKFIKNNVDLYLGKIKK